MHYLKLHNNIICGNYISSIAQLCPDLRLLAAIQTHFTPNLCSVYSEWEVKLYLIIYNRGYSGGIFHWCTQIILILVDKYPRIWVWRPHLIWERNSIVVVRLFMVVPTECTVGFRWGLYWSDITLSFQCIMYDIELCCLCKLFGPRDLIWISWFMFVQRIFCKVLSIILILNYGCFIEPKQCMVTFLKHIMPYTAVLCVSSVCCDLCDKTWPYFPENYYLYSTWLCIDTSVI